MRRLHTLSIVLLFAASSSVCYINYRLDRECRQLILDILTDSQLQAAALEVRVQDLQTALDSRQEPIAAAHSVDAIPVRFAALESDAIVDLRPETQTDTTYDFKSPDEYWDELQHYAANNEFLILNPQKQQAFLENGAALIQKLETVETHYRIDSESIQFIEAQLGDGGINAIQSLYDVKKQLAGYATEGKQYRRELDAMLHDPTPSRLPKVTHQIPRQEGRTLEYYHPALADNWILCDDAGNFLIAIRFVYRSQVGGFPKIANVQDTLNLRTMQSINGSYHYPEYFIDEIYSLVRKTFRDGFLKFHGMTSKAEQLQQFLSIIS